MNLFENLQLLNESEQIKTFNILFKVNDVYQANLIKGYSEEQVTEYFKAHKPKAEILGVKLATKDDEKPGKPVIDSTKEDVKEAVLNEWGDIPSIDYMSDDEKNEVKEYLQSYFLDYYNSEDSNKGVKNWDEYAYDIFRHANDNWDNELIVDITKYIENKLEVYNIEHVMSMQEFCELIEETVCDSGL